MEIGIAGLEIIKRNEGCVLHTYRDAVGVLTIGYGITGPEARPGRTITQEEANDMLVERIGREFEPGVTAAIGDAPTTQNQFDAMLSLAFNIGLGNFQKSTVLRRHLTDDYKSAANAFSRWNMAGRPLRVLAGLTRRRAEEAKLYLTPDE